MPKFKPYFAVKAKDITCTVPTLVISPIQNNIPRKFHFGPLFTTYFPKLLISLLFTLEVMIVQLFIL